MTLWCLSGTRARGCCVCSGTRPGRRRRTAGRNIVLFNLNRSQAEPKTVQLDQYLVSRRSCVAHATKAAPPALKGKARKATSLHKTVRGLVVEGLLRIEQDGAYAALLSQAESSSPGPDSPRSHPDGPPSATPAANKATEQNDAVAEFNPETDASAQRDTPGMVRGNDRKHGAEAGKGGQEARQTTRLIAGVTRWRRQVDAVISTLLTGERSVDDLDAPVRQILRLGVFEIIHEDLADHAVSAHVDLCAAARHRHAGALVNATLRKLLRERAAGNLAAVVPQLPAPYTGDAPEGRKELRQRVRAIALATSHPTWLVTRWLKRFGEEEAVALCHHNNRGAPAYGLRVNRGVADPLALKEQLTELGAEVSPSHLLPSDFIRVRKGMQTVLQSGFVNEGLAAVQDEAAGLVVALALRPQPHDTILDACAAPGGKALFAAAHVRGESGPREQYRDEEARAQRETGAAAGAAGGLVVAADVSAPRLQLIESMAERWGLGESVVTAAGDFRELSTPRGFDLSRVRHPALGDTADGAALVRQFDRVLVDAPCSGTGVLCKRADMRWRRGAADLVALVALQRQLLAAAVPCVRPGGLLVYSTCSLETDENEEQVEWLLAQFPGVLQVEKITAGEVDEVLGNHRGADVACLTTPEGYLQCLPHVHRCDGSFAARLRVIGDDGMLQ